MQSLVRRHWFLALLAVALVVGMTFGPRLANLLLGFPRGWIVATVMFLTALPMSFGQLAAAMRDARSVGWALTLSMAIAPLLAWIIGHMLPTSLAMGLVVAATVPCTLASAAVWTRRGGGNDAVALVVTLVTNLACFAVLPAWLWLLLRSEVAVDAQAMSMRLLTLVVAPVVLAQLLRLSPTITQAATARRPLLSYTAQCGVLIMVFFGAVSAGATLAELDASSVRPLAWAAMMLAVVSVHLILFALGWIGAGALGAGRPNQLAVAIAGSQKTLMIGLDVALSLSGLAVLPMVAYHVSQLVIDTLLVDWLRKRVAADE